MNEISFIPNDKGTFVLAEEGSRIAEMIVGITGSNMFVYHTEVAASHEGKGIGSSLVKSMVEYARKNQLKIVPICPFVKTKFEKNSQKYEDIWNKNPGERAN